MKNIRIYLFWTALIIGCVWPYFIGRYLETHSNKASASPSLACHIEFSEDGQQWYVNVKEFIGKRVNYIRQACR